MENNPSGCAATHVARVPDLPEWEVQTMSTKSVWKDALGSQQAGFVCLRDERWTTMQSLLLTAALYVTSLLYYIITWLRALRALLLSFA